MSVSSRKKMSAYDNVMGGKLRLKGKALDVKAGGVLKKKSKKKRQQKLFEQISEVNHSDLSTGTGGSTGMADEDVKKQESDDDAKISSLFTEGVTSVAMASSYEDAHLTPAERRYMEQKEKIDVHRLAKIANKSHRDRIQDFNQYLANMSEHYDIPKVGPG